MFHNVVGAMLALALVIIVLLAIFAAIDEVWNWVRNK